MPGSALLPLLIARIRAEGPMTLADYMAACLGDPVHGYYRRADPLGRAGDFVTAPEVSQMFGELIGAWTASVWEGMGQPRPVHLVELGPGRGTLMADALRVIARTAPGFRAALDLHLVETSPALRRRQQAVLPDAAWHAAWSEVPAGPTILIANEFFDALPIRQLRRSAAGWQERHVAVEQERLAYLDLPAADPALPDAPPGTTLEINPEGRRLAGAIAARLVADGGAALVIDYGARHGQGDSVQAVKAHRFHDPLADPGEADLTAHVDFGALADAAREAGAAVHGPVDQGLLLTRLGITVRAATLSRKADAAGAQRIAGELRRLIHPGEMGTLFKAMAITAPALPTPPGFAAPQ